MNITMNSPTLPAQGDTATTVNGAAPADAVLLDPALAAAQPGQATPLAFLQFMQMDAVVPGAPLAQPEPAGEASADAATGAEPAAAEAQEDGPEAAAEPLTAAMSMPMTPAMMLALPTALPAALPAAVHFGAAAAQRQERALDAVAAQATGGGAAGAVELPAAQQVAEAAAPGARAAVAQPTAAPQPPPAAAPAAVAAAAPARESGDGQAAGNGGGNNGAGAGHAGFGVAAAAAPNAAPREASTLTLLGPPTAWRQSLQEALGERLNLQLGKNAEQAVIRLEPPMLGRVEISIRHAAGSLEVNITATHSEVLRQLNTVSDNLRSDLAQRQYLDVSVNVSQAAPRAQATAQAGSSFGADAQGRGRQQGQDQDERTPGAALAEANQSTTAFSLNGRA